jgi:hypothetical protein
MNRSASLSLVVLACAACSSGSAPEHGLIEANVQALTRSADITLVKLTVSPGNATTNLTRDATDLNKFTGSITVATGNYTVHADAFVGNTVIATGDSSNVSVTKNATTQVFLTLLDTTGSPPMPDHSPVITSMVVPAAGQVADNPPLTSAAMDADGDPIAFAWSASPANCGNFSSPNTANTNVTLNFVGPCQVTLTVTANTKTATKTATIQVSPATGTISVTATYVPNPVVDSITIASGPTTICSIDRFTSQDATCHTAATPGVAYRVTIAFDAMADGSLSLQDSCGTATFTQIVFTPTASPATATWTPTGTGACILTAKLQRTVSGQTLSDQFPIVVPLTQ